MTELETAMAKLATQFSDAELAALASFLDAAASADDDGEEAEVSGFGWDGAQDQPAHGYLLQRIEAHPGFKQFRAGFTATDDLAKVIHTDAGETI